MAWEQVPEKAWQPSGAPVTGYPQSSSYGQPGGYQVMPVLDCQAAKCQIRLDVVQPHNCICVGCAAIPAVSAPAAAAVLSTGPRRLPWWPGASHPGFWCSHQTLLSFLELVGLQRVSAIAGGYCRASMGSMASTLLGPRRRACMSSSRRGQAQAQRAPRGAWPLGEPLLQKKFPLHSHVLGNLCLASYAHAQAPLPGAVDAGALYCMDMLPCC